MKEIKVGERSYHVAFNGFTPIVYSGEFSVEKPGGARRQKDIAEAVGTIAATMASVGIPAITPLLELFWACAKTADPKLEGFSDWLGRFTAADFDMTRGDGWASDMMAIVEANFFPETAKDVAPAPAETPDAGDAAGA